MNKNLEVKTIEIYQVEDGKEYNVYINYGKKGFDRVEETKTVKVYKSLTWAEKRALKLAKKNNVKIICSFYDTEKSEIVNHNLGFAEKELIELEKDQKKQAEINEVLEESTVKFSDVDGTQQIIEIEKVLMFQSLL